MPGFFGAGALVVERRGQCESAGRQAERQDEESAGGAAQGARPPHRPGPVGGNHLQAADGVATPDGVFSVLLRGRVLRL